MALPSPLPNIIMLGEFNFPNIDWSCSTTSCPMAGPLIDLAGVLFLSQKEPTRKIDILDPIFCPDDLVNYITTTDTFLSDHQINVSTSIPVPQTIPVAQSLNPSSNVFEKIDFNRADCSEKNSQILHLEELICDSHTQEKLHDEEIAVTKIKTNPNYFFRYAKKT